MAGNKTDLEKRISWMEEQMIKLKEENLSYRKDNNTMLQAIHDLYEVNKHMMQQLSKVTADQTTLSLNGSMERIRYYNLSYELMDVLLKKCIIFR